MTYATKFFMPVILKNCLHSPESFIGLAPSYSLRAASLEYMGKQDYIIYQINNQKFKQTFKKILPLLTREMLLVIFSLELE